MDAADREDEFGSIASGRTDAEASKLLMLPSGGLAYWVAAVRECFEEAGVLLAFDSSGSILSFADEEVARRFDSYRRDLNAGKGRLVGICRAEGLTLALDRNDPLRCALELVHSWRGFPMVDPGLPAELLPKPWAGDEARAIFLRLHSNGRPTHWRSGNGLLFDPPKW